MVSVDDDVKTVKIGKDDFLTLHTYYDSKGGNGPIEMVDIMRHNKSFKKMDEVNIFSPPWEPGEGTRKLVLKEYGDDLKRYCKKLAKKSYKKNCDKIKW